MVHSWYLTFFAKRYLFDIIKLFCLPKRSDSYLCLISYYSNLCVEACLNYLEGSFRYPLGKEGVYCPVGYVCIAHARQRVSYIVDLTVVRLAFFMGYE